MSNSQVTLVLTERCNYRCDMCGLVFLDSDKSREELKLNEIINIFEQSLNLFEIDEVFLTGGEIFIRDDIFDIIGYFLKKNKKVNITTNASFPEKIEMLIHYLDKMEDVSGFYKNKLGFTVSIDGIRNVHNKIRNNKKAFDNAIKTIEIIKESGIGVGVNTVIQRKNISTILEARDFFIKNNIDFCITPLYRWIGERFPYDKREVSAIIPYIDRWFDKKYIYSYGDFGISGMSCNAGKNSFVIAPNGDLYPCLTSYGYYEKKDFLLGNLKENTFDEIISSNKYNDVLNECVNKCEGCFNGCEVAHSDFNDIYLNLKEICTIKSYLNEYSYLDNMSCDLETFYDLEKFYYDGQEISFRWMNGNQGNIFINTKIDFREISIKYINGHPINKSVNADVYINDNYINSFSAINNIGNSMGRVSVEIDNYESITTISGCYIVKIVIDDVFYPSDFGSSDFRKLGLGIIEIEFM
ncbi:radical SAM additional 4Fe4S-binding domain-containing protein [Peptoanaerobacter stomatis]|uniref:Radical SAM additional 4Fe4S-binding domain-containing protein n=1 Tax=Peptoanaerobacter stomatis TaxID=796937 RepID=G9XCF3_9FIRM|nr:radical SAM protein [Peptoanaerobacter stomatis]EHL15303.1 radical SAM additional 4Fe4S-binding domain-containing protein [Peptoanaerobacter stomatis]EHL19346.1 hypothetical protein HMPREF9628_01530 [Peptoanaerobacter stomatis]